MNYAKFSLVFGFSVWFVATLAVRYWGNYLFQVENSLLLSVLYIAAIPVLYLLVNWVFNLYKLSGDTKLRSAVLMAVPGMLCDVACVKFHAIVFPVLSMAESMVMASWILWVYAVVLLIGLIQSRR